jgi:hypothetical protein
MLSETDVVAAVNSVRINGQPIAAAQLTTLLQYAAGAMLRDYHQVQAAAQAAANQDQANSGATALANAQNAAAAAQASIATLLGAQSF